MAARVFAIALVASALGGSQRPADLVRTQANDNRAPGGTLRGRVLTLHLDARIGMWYPNGEHEAGVAMPAFAEAGRAPQIPGPLLRVRAGTEVHVSIRNRLKTVLVVHGLRDRLSTSVQASTAEATRLAPGEERSLHFRLDVPGTYYYWGTTTGREVNFRSGEDAQLTGAIVVDPTDGGGPAWHDRIFVIGLWTDTTARAYVPRKRILAVINGRSWPYTERLDYSRGDTVHWRVINATVDNHPMHLHGFYFTVDARGDGVSNTTYRSDQRDRGVTESMSPGTTMDMTWVAERAGNWLFHCHLPEHIAHRGSLGLEPTRTAPAVVQSGAPPATMPDAMEDMGGLVLGIEVRDAARSPGVNGQDTRPRRHLRLVVQRNGGSDTTPYFAFTLQDSTITPPRELGLRVGPPLVLARGEPVTITVVNTLAEATSVHWHGIELESFYDGVPRFSGSGVRTAPLITPGDSFDARFTPPRAGTFIYHTHVDEERQEPAGLAGPIVVLERGEQWDPSRDHPVLITSPWSFEEGRTSVLVNGTSTPAPVVVHVGEPQRFRFINMTTRRPALRIELRRDTTLLAWRELARDGADLPDAARAPRGAMRQISVGQTFDVQVTPDVVGDMHLDIRLGGNVTEHPLFATLPLRVLP